MSVHRCSGHFLNILFHYNFITQIVDQGGVFGDLVSWDLGWLGWSQHQQKIIYKDSIVNIKQSKGPIETSN